MLLLAAQSLSGPWSSQADITVESVRTYYSQNAYDLPLGSNAIYMGDRWRSDLLGSSTYIWYPLDFSSGAPTLVAADVWSVNLAAGEHRFRLWRTYCVLAVLLRWSADISSPCTGTWSVASGTAYEAENGVRNGSSTILSDSSFSGGSAVGYLGEQRAYSNPYPAHDGMISNTGCVATLNAFQVMEAACQLLYRARAPPNGSRSTSQMGTPLGGTPL